MVATTLLKNFLTLKQPTDVILHRHFVCRLKVFQHHVEFPIYVPLQCTWKWVDIVNTDSTKRPTNLVKIVRGIYTENLSREAWQYVLVERDMEEDFFATGTLRDVTEYGFIIQTGHGKDPPADFVDKLKRCWR